MIKGRNMIREAMYKHLWEMGCVFACHTLASCCCCCCGFSFELPLAAVTTSLGAIIQWVCVIYASVVPLVSHLLDSPSPCSSAFPSLPLDSFSGPSCPCVRSHTGSSFRGMYSSSLKPHSSLPNALLTPGLEGAYRF